MQTRLALLISPFLFAACPQSAPVVPDTDPVEIKKPVVEETPKKPTSEFGVHGVAYVIDEVALIGRWDGAPPEVINVIETADDDYGQYVYGAIATADLQFDALSPAMKKMWEIPVIAFDGVEICAASLTKDVSLYYHTPFDRVEPDDVVDALKKTTPWIGVTIESPCEGMLIDQIVTTFEQDDIEREDVESYLGAGTVIDDEPNDIYVERYVEALTLGENEFLASVADEATGCGTREGTTTELVVLRQQGNGWSKQIATRVFGEETWEYGGHIKGGIVARSETGILVGETFVSFLPILEAPSPPDCE